MMMKRKKVFDMTQVVHVELPEALLKRAHIHALDEARKLITCLLEKYVQELEKAHRRQAYEAYYTTRTDLDKAEERELLRDFTCADAEITDTCY
jgi:hypothetical protein